MPDSHPEPPALHPTTALGRPPVVWYGERGVVNALVTSLSRRGVESGVRRLLRGITWADGGRPPWIDHVTDATLIVEVGLSEFGDPDLIVVCRTADSRRFVVIVEAKVITYLAKALGNAEGMAAGKNSSINRQLTLRYRFAEALAAWDGQAPTVVEPARLFEAYARPCVRGGLGDPNGRPRRLDQQEIVRRILTPLSIHSLPLDHYHLVALTWDRRPYFDDPAVSTDLRPLLLTQNGDDAWEIAKPRLGWIGYKAVKECVDPGEEFDLALQNMVRDVEPPEPETQPTTRIDTKNIENNFKDAGRETPLTLFLSQVEDAAIARFGRGAVQRGAGSTSITLGQKVLLKVIPRDPGGDAHLLLGLSTELAPSGWCEQPLKGPWLTGEGKNRQPFYFLRLPDPSQSEDAVTTADSIFGQLAVRMGLDRS